MVHTRTPYSEAADIQRALHGRFEYCLELIEVEPAKDDGTIVDNRFLVTLGSEERYHGQRFIYSVRVHG